MQLAVHSHATDDIDRLRLCAVSRVFHVRDRDGDVDVHAAEIFFPEHFDVRREEILQQIKNKENLSRVMFIIRKMKPRAGLYVCIYAGCPENTSQFTASEEHLQPKFLFLLNNMS